MWAPYDKWDGSRKLSYYMPLASNMVYIPREALNNRDSLDKTTVSIKMVGTLRTDMAAAKYIKITWKPWASFRLTKVGQQSFLLGFHEVEDFDRIKCIKWDHLVETWSSSNLGTRMIAILKMP